MEKLSKKVETSFFSLTEIILCLVLVGMALPTLGMQGHRFLKNLRFTQDVEALSIQLQLANDLVLKCNILVKVILKQTPRGLTCKLEFENKHLEKKLPTEKFYPNIKKMQTTTAKGLMDRTVLRFFCCFSGGLDNPIKISLIGDQSKKLSMVIKGYPHVLEIEK